MNKIKKFKWDIALIIAFLALGFGILLIRNAVLKTGRTVVVYVEGEEIQRFSLDKDTTYRINVSENDKINNYNILVIRDRQASVSEADCEQHICVKHKAVFKEGETIVCLPHRLVIEIE